MAEDDRKLQHRSMLRYISDEIAIRHVCLDMLKFALFDFVFIKSNLENAEDAFAIFMELDNVGHINPDDVTLLIALFKLLWLNALNDIFLKSKFQIEDVDPRDKFTPFRISIVNLSSKLQNDEIKHIANKYAVRDKKHLNPWKLLQYLQDEGKLFKENLTDFMEKTGINKDFLEWHPAKVLPTATENNRRQHWSMLQKLSHEIEHRNVNIDMLKFAVFDFVLIRRNLEYAIDAFDLFMELDNAGYINPDNVELLIALFKLLWLNSLNNEILKYEFQVENVDPKDKFNSFRISIVALSSKLQNHNIKKIADVFTVPVKKCPNPWKLLQYLQDKKKLGKGNLMDFLEKTRINKGFLTWNSANMLPPAAESVKVTLKQKQSKVESSDTGQPCSKLPKLEDDPQNGLHYLANNTRLKERCVHSAYEVSNMFSELGVDQIRSENKSIIFHISSYDPKALKNLCTMCLNEKLLEKMSEILVVKKYKQRFLGEWTIIIDEDKFNSAVSKLEQKIAFWSKITSSAALTRSTSMESGISSISTSSAALSGSISTRSALASKLTSSPELVSSRDKVSGLWSQSTSSAALPRSTSVDSGISSISTSSAELSRSISIYSAFASKPTSSQTSARSKSQETAFASKPTSSQTAARSKSQEIAEFSSSQKLSSYESKDSGISTSSQTLSSFKSMDLGFTAELSNSQKLPRGISRDSGTEDSPNVVVQNMTFLVKGRDPAEVDLTGDLTLIKDKPFIIKEGAEYEIQVKFFVIGTMVQGLKYKHITSRMGIKVRRSVFIVGNYEPNAKPYDYVTTTIKAPKGVLGRGHYTVKSKIYDDDKIVNFNWKWILDVKQ